MSKLVDAAEILDQHGIREGKSLQELLTTSSEITAILRRIIANMNSTGFDTMDGLGLSRESLAKVFLVACRNMDEWAQAHTLALRKLREDTSLAVSEEQAEELSKPETLN